MQIVLRNSKRPAKAMGSPIVKPRARQVPAKENERRTWVLQRPAGLALQRDDCDGSLPVACQASGSVATSNYDRTTVTIWE